LDFVFSARHDKHAQIIEAKEEKMHVFGSCL